MSLLGFGPSRSDPPAVRAKGMALDESLRQGGDVLVRALRRHEIEMVGAFWVLNENLKEWRLWLALPGAESAGPRQIMEKTDRIIEQLNGSTNIDLYDMDIVSPTDPNLALMVKMTGLWGLAEQGYCTKNYSENITSGIMYIHYLDTSKIFPEEAAELPEKDSG